MRRMILWATTGLVCCGLASLAEAESTAPRPATAAPVAAAAADAADATSEERLRALLEEDWSRRLAEDPILATRVGSGLYADRLPDSTPAAYRERRRATADLLARLRSIDAAELPAAARIDHAILRGLLENELAELEMQSYRTPISDRWGFHLEFLELPEMTRFGDIGDYEAYLARLRGFRDYAGGFIEVMRGGLASGWVSPRLVIEGALATIEPQVVSRAEDSLLWKPFETLPDTLAEDARERLRAAARQAISDSVVPGYRDLAAFLEHEYLPRARESIGASELPGGDAYYAQQVKRYTTLDWTPRQVHELGLAEVRRIRAEMLEVIEETGFEGDFDAFLAFLRSDPRFYPQSADELIEKASRIAKRMDGELPRLFGRLPRTPYGIKPVPDYLAPNTYPAYYEQPAGDGSKAGFYVINTYDLPSRPLYELEALTLHEAVPGHHLQLALQQELGELPPVRRFFGFTAFVEGWALYAERLGLEVGFYEDPYSDFGRLTYEMWRACRLVVDTGIHAFGWSRQRAIDFMAESSALSLHNIATEVDRYIGWPGQALGYKIGEIRIRQLRARAERELGADFDLRAFHDVVLGSGALPLTLLEANVERWIAGAGSTAARTK